MYNARSMQDDFQPLARLDQPKDKRSNSKHNTPSTAPLLDVVICLDRGSAAGAAWLGLARCEGGLGWARFLAVSRRKYRVLPLIWEAAPSGTV
jgi:hypothetical protein